MDKEVEANGKNGETGADIVESEFTEKREGRKVSWAFFWKENKLNV